MVQFDGRMLLRATFAPCALGFRVTYTGTRIQNYTATPSGAWARDSTAPGRLARNSRARSSSRTSNSAFLRRSRTSSNTANREMGWMWLDRIVVGLGY